MPAGPGGSASDGPGAGWAGLAREGTLAEHAGEEALPRRARVQRARRHRSLARGLSPDAAGRLCEATHAGAPRTFTSPRAEAREQPTASAGRVPQRDSPTPARAAGWKVAPNRRDAAGAIPKRD